MRTRFFSIALISIFLICLAGCSSCRRQNDNAFTIALENEFSTLDPNIKTSSDASSERMRQLLFSSLVKKNEKFDYVPDLASEIKRSDDGLTYTFTLHDNVKFHNGQPLTSADVKYTLETLFASTSIKAASFFYTDESKTKRPYIASIETPDSKTVVVKLTKTWLPLLSNLVSIGIIPKDTADKQKTAPVGSGPFKFVRNEGQTLVELERFADYWEGAAKIEKLIVKVVKDSNSLQAELKSDNTTMIPLPTNLTADAMNTLARDSNLKVEQFPGANFVYLGINVTKAPLDNVKVRQAIAYAINREAIVNDLLKKQAKIAYSLLPEESWAYSAKIKYDYNPEKAKQLLDEAGFKDSDGDGPQMRFTNKISFKISAGSSAISQFAQVIQQDLKKIGVPVEIEPLERNTMLDNFSKGEYQMVASSWVGGNQDPIFFKDLFASMNIPDPATKKPGLNRHRYNNPEFDKIINEAVDTADRQKTFKLYEQAQEIIARDLPLIPLWYPANMVVAQKYVANINVNQSGDWTFVRSLTVEKK
jgi:peptide/nickel transport system substrate-binding protein